MRVWIEQDECTGDGICAEIAPEVFVMNDDGLAYVKDKTGVYDNHDEEHRASSRGLVAVTPGLEEAVIESADECPGECIYIEVD